VVEGVVVEGRGACLFGGVEAGGGGIWPPPLFMCTRLRGLGVVVLSADVCYEVLEFGGYFVYYFHEFGAGELCGGFAFDYRVVYWPL